MRDIYHPDEPFGQFSVTERAQTVAISQTANEFNEKQTKHASLAVDDDKKLLQLH